MCATGAPSFAARRNRSRGLLKRRAGALAAAPRHVTAPWPSTDGRRLAAHLRAFSILATSGGHGIAQAVADEVDIQRRIQDHGCGRHPDLGAVLQYVQAAGRFQPVASTGRWHSVADAQETQSRCQQKGAVDGEGDRGQPKRDYARQRMVQDDALIADASANCRSRRESAARAPDGPCPSSRTGRSGQSRSGCWAQEGGDGENNHRAGKAMTPSAQRMMAMATASPQ